MQGRHQQQQQVTSLGSRVSPALTLAPIVCLHASERLRAKLCVFVVLQITTLTPTTKNVTRHCRKQSIMHQPACSIVEELAEKETHHDPHKSPAVP